MKLIGQFWGTSAAEGVPAPFCKCAVCEEARAHPEYRRLRTCMRLTDKVMIDLGADAVAQSIKYGDIQEVEHVLITHINHLTSHTDMLRSVQELGFPIPSVVCRDGIKIL